MYGAVGRIGVLGGVLTLAACGGSVSSAPLPEIDAGPDPYAEPDAGANGNYVSREAVCPQFVDALQKRLAELHCWSDPAPSCPATLEAFERDKLKGGPACVWVYDTGAMDNCVRRIARYATCEEFTTKPCTMVVKPLAPACM